MTRRRSSSLALALSLVLGGCAGPALCPSRTDYNAQLQKLRASGGDPARVLRIHAATELAALRPGRRYRYVVNSDGAIVIAPRPADEKGNEYLHAILGRGAPVRTAGMLRFERRGAEIDDVVVLDQASASYCPTFASLVEARAALVRVGVMRDRVRLEDHPPACLLPGATMHASTEETVDGGAPGPDATSGSADGGL